MEIDWRTIQIFLDDDGISEVSVDTNSPKKLRCTCKPFTKQAKCSHVKYVKEKMDNNHGIYTVRVPGSIPDEAVMYASEDSDSFRDFIIHYGKIVVLEEEN